MTIITGQIIGFLAVGLGFFIYQQKSYKKTIAFKMLTDFLWILHFFCLKGYTAMITTSIAVFRELAFMNSGKKRRFGIWCPVIFIVAFAFSLVFTYKGVSSIFPVISSSIATVGLWNKNTSKMRAFIFVQSAGMLIYNTVIFSVAGIINELITISSLIISVIRQRAYDKTGR